MKPSIAVCIVFFNKAELTVRCIASVAGAGLPVHVLDNGSDAQGARNVAAACAAWPNVTLLRQAENLGPAGGRNRLIAETVEEWLLFLDNDAAMETPDWAERLAAHVAAAPATEAFALAISERGARLRPARLERRGGRAVFETVRDGRSNLYPGGGTLVARRVFERLGQYDPSLWAFEEADLALRALAQGKPIDVRVIDDVMLAHHHDYLAGEADRQAVRLRYDTGRIGDAARIIEARYGIVFERGHARWARRQARDHLVAPWRRRIERGLWKLLSRAKRRLLGQEAYP